jgi:hypothetical protein
MNIDYGSEMRALSALKLTPSVRKKAVDLLKTGRYDASDAVHRARKEEGSFKKTLDKALDRRQAGKS